MEHAKCNVWKWRNGLTVSHTDAQVKTHELNCGITIGLDKEGGSISAVYVPLIRECIGSVVNESR